MRNRDKEKQIIAAATAGPWQWEDIATELLIGNKIITGSLRSINSMPGLPELVIDYAESIGGNDAAFIVAARVAWPQDLAWRERAERLLRDIQWVVGYCPVCGKSPFEHPEGKHRDNCELAKLMGGEN